MVGQGWSSKTKQKLGTKYEGSDPIHCLTFLFPCGWMVLCLSLSLSLFLSFSGALCVLCVGVCCCVCCCVWVCVCVCACPCLSERKKENCGTILRLTNVCFRQFITSHARTCLTEWEKRSKFLRIFSSLWEWHFLGNTFWDISDTDFF